MFPYTGLHRVLGPKRVLMQSQNKLVVVLLCPRISRNLMVLNVRVMKVGLHRPLLLLTTSRPNRLQQLFQLLDLFQFGGGEIMYIDSVVITSPLLNRELIDEDPLLLYNLPSPVLQPWLILRLAWIMMISYPRMDMNRKIHLCLCWCRRCLI